MIDAIVFKLKTVYRFDTDNQSQVEHFCCSILNVTTREYVLSDPEGTDSDKRYRKSKFYRVKIKAWINNRSRRYKYRIG